MAQFCFQSSFLKKNQQYTSGSLGEISVILELNFMAQFALAKSPSTEKSFHDEHSISKNKSKLNAIYQGVLPRFSSLRNWISTLNPHFQDNFE